MKLKGECRIWSCGQSCRNDLKAVRLVKHGQKWYGGNRSILHLTVGGNGPVLPLTVCRKWANAMFDNLEQMGQCCTWQFGGNGSMLHLTVWRKWASAVFNCLLSKHRLHSWSPASLLSRLQSVDYFTSKAIRWELHNSYHHARKLTSSHIFWWRGKGPLCLKPQPQLGCTIGPSFCPYQPSLS